MSANYVVQEARPLPPTRGNINVVAVTTDSANTNIVPLITGKGDVRMRMVADGGDVYILFGPDENVTASATSASGNTRSWMVPSGKEAQFVVNESSSKFLAYITGSSTANLRFYISTHPSNIVRGT